MKIYKLGKSVNIKILIWYMVGKWLQNGVGQGFIFHAIIPAHNTF